MPEIWPPTLPDYLLKDGYSEMPPEVTLRTRMETGPAKVRRRATNAVRPIRGTVRLSAAQKALLDAFYVDTLVGGSLAFDWVHPVTRGAASFRFVTRPTFTPAAGTNWNAALDLEILP